MWTKFQIIHKSYEKIWGRARNFSWNFKESKVLMQRLLLKIVLHHVHGGCPVKINLLLQNNWVLKIFAIIPHSASCERMFSALGWLYGKENNFGY